jgi:gamma-glutamyltranspeptidase
MMCLPWPVSDTSIGLQTLGDVQNIAFADRNKYMGDADFINLPLPPFTQEGGGLMSKEYAAQRWAELGGATQSQVQWGTPPDYTVTLGVEQGSSVPTII